MATLLARDAELLVTMDADRRELRRASLFAEDGWIVAIGPADQLPAEADTVLDLSGQIVLPGLINTHHHLSQSLGRNILGAQEARLFDWLTPHFPLWGAVTPEALRLATQVGCAELALAGCTTVFDHTYVFRNGCAIDGIIDAARELGVRLHAGRGSISLGRSQGGVPPDGLVEDEAVILADSERAIRCHHQSGSGALTRLVLAPCSPFSVSSELLRASAALARRHPGVRLHTHLAETLDEERYTLETHGLRPLAYMERQGWLAPDVWFAHGVHLDGDDIRRLARARAGIAHCPSSNMRLASGLAPVMELLAAGVPVGLGVDGAASGESGQLLHEVRQAFLLARLRLGLECPLGTPPQAAWMTARQALELATLGGAAVLGRDDIGRLAVGCCADFFSLSLGSVAYAGALHDPVAAVVFCAPQPAVHTVVHGRVIVEGGQFTTIDLPAVVARHNTVSGALLAVATADGTHR
jgi:cytosine/adenosine deaminase-related metal-dependent hydrolase